MQKKATTSPDLGDLRWRSMKNVVVISLAFMLHFTAYSGAANLQSSINAEAGLGTASLAAVYAGLIISNVFLPAVVIRWIGCKWSIAVSFISYMPYIAAQLYPKFWTLIPAGLLVGLGGGPLWCGKCTYLFTVAELWSKTLGESAEVLLARFLGIFYMIFQLNQVWGNLVSSLVLSSGDNLAAKTTVNASTIPELCGANFLPSEDAGEALQQQPAEKIQMIAGIYLACMAGATILVAIGVDSIKDYENERSKKTDILSGKALLAVTVKLLIEPTQMLLIMVNVFIGLQQATFGADFTAAFVSCAIGTGTVGFIMLTYGLANALGCITTGYLAKHTGRLPLVTTGLVVHTALYTTLLLWRPQPWQSYVMFIIAACWGFTDSFWVLQINVFYGLLFPGREEAAFSNFRLWESVGFIIAYIISTYVRTTHKTYLLFGTMFSGYIMYLIVEFMVRRAKVKEVTCGRRKDVSGCQNDAFSSEL